MPQSTECSAIQVDNITIYPLKIKPMTKKMLFIILLLNSYFIVFSQNIYEPGKIRIIVNDPTIIPLEGGISKSLPFQQILTNFNISEITQVMPFAKIYSSFNL